jgi:hypothetical protein
MSNTSTYLPLVFLKINCTEVMNLLILSAYAGTRMQKNIYCNLNNRHVCFPINIASAL